LLGKSGTAAAARDLGLPVLVARDDWRSRAVSFPTVPDDTLIAVWPATGALDWPAFIARRRAPVYFTPTLALDFSAALAAA